MSFLGPDTPGPGSYEPRTRGSRDSYNPSFTLKAKRKSTLTENVGPGPGAYRLPNETGSRTPAFTFAKKYEGFHMSHGPGPLSYDLTPRKRGGPSFTMGGRTKLPDATRDVPGPGSHSPREHQSMTGSDTLTRKNSPRIRISPRTRPSRSNMDDVPGPGAYTPSDRVTQRGSPGFSMRQRYREPLSQRDRNPGPGQYTPTDPQDPKVTKRGFSFGKRGDLYKLPPHNVNFAQPRQIMSSRR